MVGEVGVAEVAQAMSASGIGVAILYRRPGDELRKLYIDGRDGPLHITLHAAWNPTHYAAATIREFAAALAAHTAAVAHTPG